MKGLSGQRTRDRAVRTDQPQVEPKLFRDGQGKSVPSTGNQHNFNARGVRSPHGYQITFRNLELWIEQRAIDVGRQQSDGRPGNLHLQ